MSLIITEALILGLKEGLKAWAVWFVFSGMLVRLEKEDLLKYFYAGLVLVSLLAASSFFLAPDAGAKDFAAKLTGYTFFLFYMGSIGALYQSTGYPVFGAWNARPSGIVKPSVVFLTAVFFAPDVISSSFYIRELSMMKQSAFGAYASGALGFALPLLTLPFASARRLRLQAGRSFGIAQLLLFLSVVKLLGGGASGFGELSLIPAVQRGIMRFFHDFIHHLFVFLMVPDHPILSTTTWNFIGILFGPGVGLAVALCLLLLPAAVFLARTATAPLPLPEGAEGLSGAEKRIIKSGVREMRRRRMVPVAAFIIAILAVWFAGGGEGLKTYYNPAPRPVVSDKGIIVIPLNDPTMNLRDGRLYKFSLILKSEKINFIVIARPDNTLAVALDACEICPPEGYGQTEGHVVCIYCLTPIPIQTIGQPGGCNPIPVKAEVLDTMIRIKEEDIGAVWEKVKRGGFKDVAR